MAVAPRLLSLLTTARDPDPRILDRVLRAVRALRVPAGWQVEHLVVDGCDAPLVASEPLAGHLAAYPAARVVRQPPRGNALAHALGVRLTSGELVVNVDDDNVLAPDYLEVAVASFEAEPELGTLGSGAISVEWVDQVPAWADDARARELFQHRALPAAARSETPAWEPFWPPGTGLVRRRAVAEAYRAGVEEGGIRYAVPGDRPPQGGDDFILHWLALRAGLRVGADPRLRVVHLIPADRVEPHALRRLQFGAMRGGALSHAAIFPEHYGAPPSVLRVARELWREAGPPWRAGEHWLAGVRAAQLAGLWHAAHEIAGRAVPWWLRRLERRLGVG